jgi:hypothetical protein
MPVEQFRAEIRLGGWQGKSCPNLCINSLYSWTLDGRTLFSQVTKEAGGKLCRALLPILAAEWIVCQHWYAKPFQVVCYSEDIDKTE